MTRTHIGSFLLHHLRSEWRASVFVTSLVIIASHYLGWLTALNNLALLAVGNAAVVEGYNQRYAEQSERYAVVAVRIDGKTYDERYHQRSPIPRCPLREQLRAVYAANPEVVVVDIDLAPAYRDPDSATDRQEEVCENELYALMKAQRAREPEPVQTVLLQAAESTDRAWEAGRRAWMLDMKAAGLAFGIGEIPVSYGMTNEYWTSDSTLSAAVERALNIQPRPGEGRLRIIDPRTYRFRIKALATPSDVVPSAEAADYSAADRELTRLVNAKLPPRVRSEDGSRPRRVVFFGIGEGNADTFVTPVGRVYGVELHAAAFATASQPNLPEWVQVAIDLVVDFLLALTFGLLIGACWRRYFLMYAQGTPAHAQLASFWIVAMLVSLTAAVAGATWVALWLMGFGIWISPLPIALGMFVESCVKGSVVQAGRLLRKPALDTPQALRESSLAVAMGRIWHGLLFCVWVLTIGYALWLESEPFWISLIN